MYPILTPSMICYSAHLTSTSARIKRAKRVYMVICLQTSFPWPTIATESYPPLIQTDFALTFSRSCNIMPFIIDKPWVEVDHRTVVLRVSWSHSVWNVSVCDYRALIKANQYVLSYRILCCKFASDRNDGRVVPTWWKWQQSSSSDSFWWGWRNSQQRARFFQRCKVWGDRQSKEKGTN